MIQPLLDEFEKMLTQALIKVELSFNKYSDAILVGGSMRVPLFRTRLQSLFKYTRLHYDDKLSDQALAFGAATQVQEGRVRQPQVMQLIEHNGPALKKKQANIKQP